MERQLGELCLDPAAALVDGSPWYFPTLVSTLRELMATHIAALGAATHNTAIGEQVSSALDYALATGPQTQAQSWAEFARWAKEPANKPAFGSPGAGTVPHFIGTTVAQRTGLVVVADPHRGPDLDGARNVRADRRAGRPLPSLSCRLRFSPRH